MAPIKLAATLTRFSHKIFVTLTYSFLEWIMIALLLSNSFYSYMIRKFALYFGLKQPCILCSRVDLLLDPTKKTTDFYKTLVCENHATEISKLGYCSNHQRFTETQQMCEECVPSKPKNVSLDQTNSDEKTPTCSCCEKVSKNLHFPFRGSLLIKENEEEKGVVIGCKVNDVGNHSSSECEPQILSDVGSFCLREAAEEDSNEEDEVDDHAADGKKSVVESSMHGSVMDGKMKANHDIFYTINQLKSDFEAEQNARNELYAELEAERNAAAIAANQTMAMITRLQEEKAAMQMEALHYQRVMEEQAEYDQEALQLLNELVARREKEKQDLENELDVYRERISDYEAKDKEMMLIEKCGGNKNFSSSCSIDNDSDVLSIDLNCHYNKVEESDFSLMDCSKQWGGIEDSLEELEEERMSIIKQLKALEEKLQKAQKQEEKRMADNILVEQEKNELETNSEVCSQEVNLVSSSFSTSVTSESHSKTMASVARKLLDLVESDDEEMENMGTTNEVRGTTTDLAIAQVEFEGKRASVHKEMDHVYGRLQALEADAEFLRHCIGSINKGNEGLNMLREILQHLRELRDAEICL